MSETNNNDFDIILKSIHEEILPLLDDAILDDKIIFNNPNLKVCWKIKKCERDTDLPPFSVPGVMRVLVG